MPDLFQAEQDRDQRFREEKDSPIPVEPLVAQDATIPTAPTLRKPKYTSMHIFTSYCELPPHVTFENQEEDEKILLFLRRSFITNINWIFVSLFFFVIPPLFHILLYRVDFHIPPNYTIVALLFYYLLVASYFFMSFITWYFNIILITDKRIVDIDFEELVYKNIAETKLSLVQDVSYTQAGAIRTVTDYGDILIQTAGPIDNFDWHAIPRPERVVNIVEDLIGKGQHV